MDNVTHSLAGMLMAETVCALKREARPALRTAAYVTAVLANNLPDLDPIYASITSPRRLGSLLHHRGHTHTLVFAIPAGLLLAFGVLAWLSRRRGPFEPAERRSVAVLGAVGAAAHLGMDFGNNYGVHPFWPFQASWFYGDSIFIVEPLFWAILLPALALAARLRVTRVVLGVLLALVVSAAAALPFITQGTVAAICLLAAASAAIARSTSPLARVAAAWGGLLAVTTTFVVASSRAERLAREAATMDFTGLQVHDVVTTPMPGNPLCWSALVVATHGGEYRALYANVAPLPAVSDAATCPSDATASPTAPREALRVAPRPELRWLAMHRAPLDTLRAFARDDCAFAALLLFARAPYLVAAGDGLGGEGHVAGDLRYDRSGGLDFSDLLIPRQHECPRWLPSWTPPRRDLIFGSD